MKLSYQKYIVAFVLFCINMICSTTFVIYDSKWYAYLFILLLASLINTFSVICIGGYKIITNDKHVNRLEPKTYVYVVPCYNESEEELTQSIHSLTLQRYVKHDKRALFVICDGIVKGKGNTTTTDVILKKIFNINELAVFYDYKTWDNTRNILKIYTGVYTHLNEIIPFILMIKNTNIGKRDSLVLARKLCYSYNNGGNSHHPLPPPHSIDGLTKYMYDVFKSIFDSTIDFIIGIDADTVFDYNCSYELIKEIDKDINNHGCVGYVDILPTTPKQYYSPYILYQYGEYMFSQCLRRYAQSTITKKVNCLSGCNQILRVSKETCGHAMLSVLNYLPMPCENIFNHIRSYASEDRNHICHMLSMYPHVQSVQALNAVAYTSVPTSMSVFLSQRRRWTLGATTNDMLLIYMPDINPFERIAAFVNVMTFCFIPFIFVATVMFIKAIITAPTMLMLYLSIVIFIPLLYAFVIPIFIRPLTFRDSMYYYLSYLFFIGVGSIIKLITYGYSIYHMDNITWGRTREIMTNDTSHVDDSPSPSETAIEIIDSPTSSDISIDTYCWETVMTCSPKKIMKEYIDVYCKTNEYETSSDVSNKVYEINI